MSVLSHLDALERALVAGGFPPMSLWWRATFARFYASGKRQLVIRAGRRAGKSSTLCRLAVLEALFGDHKIPTGDAGVVAIVSVERRDSEAKIRTIQAILQVLKIAHRRAGDSIDLDGRPIRFQIFSASLAGVVGFTSIFVVCDEVAKWRDVDTGTNPAAEVLASLRPTTATQPNAKIVLSSSPLSTLDTHFETFERGETDYQSISHAPTWIANPTVTEAETHALEPDERIWRREYAAVPQASALAAFDEDAIARAFRAAPVGWTQGARVGVVDASSGKKDAWTFGEAAWFTEPITRASVLVVSNVDAIEGSFWAHTTADNLVALVAARFRAHGVSSVHGDQREAFLLRSEFARNGFSFIEHAWSSASKPTAVERVRRWLADGLLILPEHEGLRRELARFEERITASGQITFAARSGHDDFVALLVTLALADIARLVPTGGAIFSLGQNGARVGPEPLGSCIVGRPVDDYVWPDGSRSIESGGSGGWW